MKVLFLSAYCEPEQVSGSKMIHDLWMGLIASGHSIIDYVPMPTRGISNELRKEYKRKRIEIRYNGNLVIHRFPMFRERTNGYHRAVRYILVNIAHYYFGCREKDIDVIYLNSTPPTEGLLGALLKRRLNKPFVYCLQDIFPDSLVNTGMARKNGVLWKIGRRIENYTYSHADMIIVISEGFKRNLMAKGVPAEKISVVSNWVDLDAVIPIDRKLNKLFDEFGIYRSKFVIVYAGNIGEAQGAEVIIDAAKRLIMEPNIQFVIFGGGARYQEIKDRVEKEKISNVFITGLQAQERVSEVYSMGDVALITCKPGTGNAGLPSKTWSIMACNTPIIASFDTDSDLADVLKESGAGCCVEPGNQEALTEAIRGAYEDWKQGKCVTDDIRSYAIKTASKNVCVQRYIDVMLSAAGRVLSNGSNVTD